MPARHGVCWRPSLPIRRVGKGAIHATSLLHDRCERRAHARAGRLAQGRKPARPAVAGVGTALAPRVWQDCASGTRLCPPSYVPCQAPMAQRVALSTIPSEVIDAMIVQGWERSLKTSVNKLLSAGSRMSVLSSGAFPVYERASTSRSASRVGREFPCRGCAPAIARGMSSPDHAPALGSLKVAANDRHTPLRQTRFTWSPRGRR